MPVATRAVAKAEPMDLVETSFAEVVGLIEQAPQRAYQAVNSELVGLYWRIGEYISAKLAAAVWGEGVVDSLAQHLARTMPGQRGFTRQDLFRFRQLFCGLQHGRQESDSAADTTAVDPQPDHSDPVSAPRGARVLLASGDTGKVEEPRAGGPIQPRNLRARSAESSKVSAALTQMHGTAGKVAARDAYTVEFVSLPPGRSEADSHSRLLAQILTGATGELRLFRPVFD